MHGKIREQHKLAVPRNLVYDVMVMVDPEGLERRGNVGQKKGELQEPSLHWQDLGNL